MNYGHIPQTLAGDGGPVDVLVITPMPLMIGSVIPCRAIGLLKMEDEAGEDAKVLTVPTSKLTKLYDGWKEPGDVSPVLPGAITHFFEHYKDHRSALLACKAIPSRVKDVHDPHAGAAERQSERPF